MQDEREKRARDLYERMRARTLAPGTPPIARWEGGTDLTPEWWMLLVDVIGEIERERHPLREVDVTAQIAAAAFAPTLGRPMGRAFMAAPNAPQPLTEAEARAWTLHVVAKCDPRMPTLRDWSDALKAASRGAIPPEVRRYDHGVDCPCPACSVQTAAMREMAEPWTPTPGDRVRTVERLTSSFAPGFPRKPNAAGEAVWIGDHVWVSHDDGAEAPYDADELRPEPEAPRSICGRTLPGGAKERFPSIACTLDMRHEGPHCPSHTGAFCPEAAKDGAS